MTADSQELLRGQLLREKRLMLLVSAILLAHQWLGIRVTNSVESLGFHFEIASPARLWIGVGIVWIWALVRYGQLLYSFSPSRDFPHDRYIKTRMKLCDWIITRQVQREAQAVFRTIPRSDRIRLAVTNLGRSEPGSVPSDIRSRRATGQFRLRFSIVRSVPYDPVPTQPLPQLEHIGDNPRTRGDIVAWVRTGDAYEIHERERRCDVFDSIEVPVEMTEQRRLVRWLARVWTVLATSYGTEHYVPLAIGLAPLLGLCLGLPVTSPTKCSRVLLFGLSA